MYKLLKNFKQNQSGIASLVVSIAIVTVISLIIVSFSTLMRREQRQALDQQLSSQAFYAAESALNEKIAEISRRSAGTPITPVTSCNSRNLFNSADEIKSTCVLVDPYPESLEYDEVIASRSTAVVLEPEPSRTFSEVTISWEQKEGAGNCSSAAYTTLPTSLGGNSIGMLRIDMTRFSHVNITRDSLVNNTFSALLYPRSGGTSTNNFGVNQLSETPVTFGRCSSSSTYRASATIRISPASPGPFLLHMRGVYKPSRVRITARDGAGVVRFKDAQIVIDSTARVNDVLRRVQARVPVSVTPGEFPNYALRAATDVCKLLNTRPGTTSDGC